MQTSGDMNPGTTLKNPAIGTTPPHGDAKDKTRLKLNNAFIQSPSVRISEDFLDTTRKIIVATAFASCVLLMAAICVSTFVFSYNIHRAVTVGGIGTLQYFGIVALGVFSLCAIAFIAKVLVHIFAAAGVLSAVFAAPHSSMLGVTSHTEAPGVPKVEAARYFCSAPGTVDTRQLYKAHVVGNTDATPASNGSETTGADSKMHDIHMSESGKNIATEDHLTQVIPEHIAKNVAPIVPATTLEHLEKKPSSISRCPAASAGVSIQ